MERHDLYALVEALLFSAEDPVTPQALLKAVDDPDVTSADLRAVLDSLQETYAAGSRGVQLLKLGSGWQIVTRERFAPWIENLLKTRRKARLSRAALETVAVIAYKQPISRVDVERIRGVDVGGVVNTLLERGLVMVKGRDPGPGRPLLYGTTQTFLEHFGLSSLTDLPRLEELADLAGVTRLEWDEKERERFEKFGVDLESVPTPPSLLHPEEEGEATLDDEPEPLEHESVADDTSGDVEPPAEVVAGDLAEGEPAGEEDPETVRPTPGV
jgi:segregation and condensation protein B